MGKTVKVATWNVNSIKARRDAVLDWIDRNRPDVLCLQELKTTDDAFPFFELKALGYAAVTNSQKTYNGVAIISRTEPSGVTRGMGDNDPQARLISAEIGGIRFVSAYVPNGAEVVSDKYLYKLEWLARFREWVMTTIGEGTDAVICGDFNIAASELDVHRPADWEGTVIWNPRMRGEFELLAQCGLHDLFRELNPSAKDYSWWDYRMGGFQRNNGLRIDYIMGTGRLAGRAVSASIDRAERAKDRPSDHAPVIVEFSLA